MSFKCKQFWQFFHIRSCSVYFIFSLDAKGIQDVCQSALHDFNLCMFSQSYYDVSDGQHPCDDKPCHLSDEIVFKIFVICLAIIHIMQKEGKVSVQMNTCFLFRNLLFVKYMQETIEIWIQYIVFLNFILFSDFVLNGYCLTKLQDSCYLGIIVQNCVYILKCWNQLCCLCLVKSILYCLSSLNFDAIFARESAQLIHVTSIISNLKILFIVLLCVFIERQ